LQLTHPARANRYRTTCYQHPTSRLLKRPCAHKGSRPTPGFRSGDVLTTPQRSVGCNRHVCEIRLSRCRPCCQATRPRWLIRATSRDPLRSGTASDPFGRAHPASAQSTARYSSRRPATRASHPQSCRLPAAVAWTQPSNAAAAPRRVTTHTRSVPPSRRPAPRSSMSPHPRKIRTATHRRPQPRRGSRWLGMRVSMCMNQADLKQVPIHEQHTRLLHLAPAQIVEPGRDPVASPSRAAEAKRCCKLDPRVTFRNARVVPAPLES